MKYISTFLLAIILTFTAVFKVNAQSAETIWLTANTTAYKTGETVIVTVNAISGTLVQGFTFQIRYDPACLQPINAASPISGMNGLSLPQLDGVVDASFASTTPQTVNGVLAEVQFVALSGCQTNLTLESAALAIRNESGFAAPLAGVSVGEKTVALDIAKSIGTSATQPVMGTPLVLGEVPPPPAAQFPTWAIVLIVILVGAGLIFGIFKLLRPKAVSAPKKLTHSKVATVQIKRGTLAGRIFPLTKLPCRIGSDANNEIRLDDPQVTGQHVKIFAANNEYYLMDLGGETFINGMAITKSSAVLHSGDTVRLGRNVFFEFGF